MNLPYEKAPKMNLLYEKAMRPFRDAMRAKKKEIAEANAGSKVAPERLFVELDDLVDQLFDKSVELRAHFEAARNKASLSAFAKKCARQKPS